MNFTAETGAQPHITLVSLRLPHFPHSAAYQDLAFSVYYALMRAGHEIRLGFSPAALGPRSILFGAHLLRHFPEGADAIPHDTFIYNTEHTTSDYLDDAYLALLRGHQVWDYSADNAAALADLLGMPVRHVPLGHVPEMSRIAAVAEDIDVLFYGSLNPRREAVIEAMRAAGLRVEVAFGVYGTARDALIARARLVLNVHFYQPGHFEVLRVGYLMANRKAVLNEVNPGETVDADLERGLACVPYEQLAATAAALIADDAGRRALADRGYLAFAARDAAASIARALPAGWQAVAGRVALPPVLPEAIVIGSGKAFDINALNIDIDARWYPDIVADITKPDLFEQDFTARRFGRFRLIRRHFAAIMISHVLEHLPDLVTAMTNCLDLLADGGLMYIAVPYDLSYGAWQDPTHVRAFNERSWWYYTDWYWYLGWSEARFDLVSQEFIASPIGAALREQGMAEEEIRRTPRAIDEMRVVLRRRSLTPAEIAHGAAMRGEHRSG